MTQQAKQGWQSSQSWLGSLNLQKNLLLGKISTYPSIRAGS